MLWGSGFLFVKLALRGLSRALNGEGEPYGIRSACICPGLVATEMAEGAMDPAAMIQVEDVAASALYLAY